MRAYKRGKERERRQKGRAGRVEMAWGQQVQMAARPHTHPPIPNYCAQHPQTPAWVPLCIRTLLSALQGRWGLQAGGALRGRVPQLRGGITFVAGESREALWHRLHSGSLFLPPWKTGKTTPYCPI